MALYTSSQGSSASAAPDYRMVCSHSSMVVSGQGPAMDAKNFYGLWVCTHSPNGAGSARRWTAQQRTVWPEERGAAAHLCDLASGTYFPARVILARILKAPEPTGRTSCCPLRV